MNDDWKARTFSTRNFPVFDDHEFNGTSIAIGRHPRTHTCAKPIPLQIVYVNVEQCNKHQDPFRPGRDISFYAVYANNNAILGIIRAKINSFKSLAHTPSLVSLQSLYYICNMYYRFVRPASGRDWSWRPRGICG